MKNIFINRYKEWGQKVEPKKVKVKPALRANTIKCDEKELVLRLKKKGVKLEKISWLKNGYFYNWDKSLSSTPEYLLGYFYLQNAASQIPAEELNPDQDETVLDMAAAPGGKTTHISKLMKNKGKIVALDIKRERIESLKNNIERMGSKNIVVYNKDAAYANDLEIIFDKVLLDAPCTGNFCIDSEWFEKRNIEDFSKKALLQKKLLKSGISVLKKGGVLVYSTCSLEKEENEDVIEWALDNLNVKLINLNTKLGSSGLTKKTLKARRFWPNKTNTQGFFIAKLVKE